MVPFQVSVFKSEVEVKEAGVVMILSPRSVLALLVEVSAKPR